GYVGGGSNITAGGGVTVNAVASNTPSQTFDDFIKGVDTSTSPSNATRSAINFPSHGLADGSPVVYNRGNATTPIQVGGINLAYERQIGALVVNDDNVRLGANFNAQTADTGGFENAAFGIDAFRRVIKFPTQHLFQTGDAVWYDPKGSPSLVGGLNT